MADSLKLLYLNVYRGCPEEDRFLKLIKFINEFSPDVLGLSELTDWDKDDYKKLKIFLDKTKYTHYIFGLSKTRYPLGLFSKFLL